LNATLDAIKVAENPIKNRQKKINSVTNGMVKKITKKDITHRVNGIFCWHLE